jgi:hypothetical protein
VKRESSAEASNGENGWNLHSAPVQPARSAGATSTGRVLWLAVTLGFLCLATAWFFAFRAAHRAQIRDVPLATKGGRP